MFVCLLAAVHLPAYGRSPAEDALNLAHNILAEPTGTNVKIKHTDYYENREIRNDLVDLLVGRKDADIEPLMQKAHEAKLQNIDIFIAFRELRKHQISDFKSNNSYKLLVSSTSSEDWRRANLANMFLAQHYSKQKQNFPALKYAQAALANIPKSTYTLEIGDALYDTYEVLSTVFIYDRNVSKAVDASVQMIKHGKQAGRKIDPVSMVFNLSVLFSNSRDFETATKITELLVVKTATSNSNYERALANLGHGKNLIAQDEYQPSIHYLELAKTLAPDTIIEPSAMAHLGIAYAKTSNLAKAKESADDLKILQSTKPALKPILLPFLQQIEFVIAAQEGNYKRALELHKDWAGAEIKKLEALADKDRRQASEQLAINEQVAQAEFQNLKEKTALQEQVIVKERQYRYTLMALLAALSIIVVLLIYARFKQKKVNKQLAIAAVQAKAGEEAKSRFLAVMSHELRTPMNPIIALSHLLSERIHDKENRRLISLVRISAEGLMNMIENIMAVADNTGADTINHADIFDFREFVTELALPFYTEAQQKKLKFNLRFELDFCPEMKLNKSALRLAICNLLSNAIKFTHKGSVNLSVTRSAENENEAIITVQDTGIGMDEADIPHLLKVFEQRDSSFTREYGGTGIGLHVANEKAKLIGARMRIQSEQGVGTTATLFVPYTRNIEVKQAA